MSETLVWNSRLGVNGMPKSEYLRKYGGMEKRSDIATPMIVRDIEPYKSVATGEQITSRSQHREMLRSNGLVEVGNDFPTATPKKELPPVQEDVARAIEDVKAGRGVKVSEHYNPNEFED